VEAVTVVAGNVPVEQGVQSLARLMGVIRPDPPPLVAAGAPAPRAGPLLTATYFHGEDGLGGLGDELPEGPLTRYAGDAADLLLDCARRWGDELVLVALGPLTNVAAALDRDPAAVRRVRRVVVMGGAVARGGNTTAAAEYNIYVDPEAAAHVLAAGLPVVLVPLDVTHQVVWPAGRVERLAGATDPVARAAYAIARRGLAAGAAAGEGGIVMHDPLAVAVAADPTLVGTERLPVAVETAGKHTRGATVVDRRPPAPWRRIEPNCQVALRVEAERFLRLFEERVCPGSS
jgi:inosine-uridine nucleoside N-ribohydrolase